MNKRSNRAVVVVMSFACALAAFANPKVVQSFKPDTTEVIQTRPIAAVHGSVLIKDAVTTDHQGCVQPFRAVLFPQRLQQTGDHVQSHASVHRTGSGNMLNHVVLERGILVVDSPDWILDLGGEPEGLGVATANALVPRPYPITTIRSIGAGAEGAIVIIAVTTGIVTPQGGGGVFDVVMMYLSKTNAESRLHAFRALPGTPADIVTLPAGQSESDFLSVTLTTDANGVTTAGAPVVRSLNDPDYAEIKALRDSLIKLHTSLGQDFWAPGH